MGGHFVYVPDPADPPKPARVGLFEDAKDINSVHECAEHLGVCDMTVRRLIARGELQCVHVGRAVRVTRQALIDFIEGQVVRHEG